MSSGGLTGGIYKPLNPEQVELIHGEALRLLEQVGLTYEDGQRRFSVQGVIKFSV